MHVIAFDQPGELGYHCPVCVYDSPEDDRLDWSEYNGFLWCAECNTDYPSALCQPDITKAVDTFLSTVSDAVRGAPLRAVAWALNLFVVALVVDS